MEAGAKLALQARQLVSALNRTPIHGLSLSAGGLLALADLQTIAQRTALTGGSSWLDALVLAPGLHYQQAADSLIREGGSADLVAVEHQEEGKTQTFAIHNQATINYMRRVAGAAPKGLVTVDVGLNPKGGAYGRRRRRRKDDVFEDPDASFDIMTHVLYLASPILTITAIVLEILLEDWWGLSFIIALMISRILNIYVIKQRIIPSPTPADPQNPHPSPRQPPAPAPPSHHHRYNSPPPSRHRRHGSPPTHRYRQSQAPAAPETTAPDNRLTEYYCALEHGGVVRLRGVASDLEAITRSTWLRNKTFVQGYLEAGAKLVVYLVASMSGNLSQAGAITLMALLLLSSALLGLSNSHATKFLMRGRVARARPDAPPDTDGDGTGDPPPHGHHHYPGGHGGWKDGSTTATTSSGYGGLDDWAEKGQTIQVVGDAYPFNNSVDYN